MIIQTTKEINGVVYDYTYSDSGMKAFGGIQSDCQMLIPAALYDEWSAATNWATYAKYMVAV